MSQRRVQRLRHQAHRPKEADRDDSTAHGACRIGGNLNVATAVTLHQAVAENEDSSNPHALFLERVEPTESNVAIYDLIVTTLVLLPARTARLHNPRANTRPGSRHLRAGNPAVHTRRYIESTSRCESLLQIP